MKVCVPVYEHSIIIRSPLETELNPDSDGKPFRWETKYFSRMVFSSVEKAQEFYKQNSHIREWEKYFGQMVSKPQLSKFSKTEEYWFRIMLHEVEVDHIPSVFEVKVAE